MTTTMTPVSAMEKRGTCPACFGVFQIYSDANGNPVLGKHGWREVGGRRVGQYGNATHQGECFGVGLPPFEISPVGTRLYVNVVIFPSTLGAQNGLTHLQNRPVLLVERKNEILKLSPGELAYERELRGRITQAKLSLETLLRTGTKLEETIASWAPADLLEGARGKRGARIVTRSEDTMSNEIQLSSVTPGTRVVGFSGYGANHVRTGTVLGLKTDRWGSHLDVEMEDGSKESVHSLNGEAACINGRSFYPISGHGCGWFTVVREETTPTESR